MLLALYTSFVVAALAASVGAAAPPSVDCTAGRCPEIVVAGDPPASTPSHGHADPSVRKDPRSARLWMVYSWPHTTSFAGRAHTAVDTHLARSDDGGRTWRFDRRLWSSTHTARTLRNSEAVSIAANGGRWFSARDSYVIAAGRGITSYRLRFAAASSPRLLANAPEAAPDLASLAPELRGCLFRDAGLLFHRGRLRLAVQCSRFSGSRELYEQSFVAVFSTTAIGAPARWRWRYHGRLAGHADAVALGGDALLQTELTRARDGRLLAVFSPSGDIPTSPLASHNGCRVVEVASLDRPRLGRVVADIRATDLLPVGNGACSYEPASATGVLIVRRTLEQRAVQVGLLATGLRP
jgi:hypothetical protein